MGMPEVELKAQVAVFSRGVQPAGTKWDPAELERLRTVLADQLPNVTGYLGSPEFTDRINVMKKGPLRGILINGGGIRLYQLVIQLKVVGKTLNCALPIQVVWHNAREMKPKPEENKGIQGKNKTLSALPKIIHKTLNCILPIEVAWHNATEMEPKPEENKGIQGKNKTPSALPKIICKTLNCILPIEVIGESLTCTLPIEVIRETLNCTLTIEVVIRETLNCTLPIEVVWHNATEMDPSSWSTIASNFAPITGFSLYDRQYPSHHRMPSSGPLSGFAAKAYSLYHTSFQQDPYRALLPRHIPSTTPASSRWDVPEQVARDVAELVARIVAMRTGSTPPTTACRPQDPYPALLPSHIPSTTPASSRTPIRLCCQAIFPLPHQLPAGPLSGFAAKPYSLYHTSFQQWVVAEQEHGNLLWPSMRGEWVSNEAYTILGLDYNKTKSGQLLFDRIKHADVLEHLLWINSYSDVMYRYLHGDKDTFPLAFATAGKASHFRLVPIPPGAMMVWAPNVVVLRRSKRRGLRDGYKLQGVLQHDPFGRPMFLHRTISKFWFGSSPPFITTFTAPLPYPWLKWYLAQSKNLGPSQGLPSAIAAGPEAFDLWPKSPLVESVVDRDGKTCPPEHVDYWTALSLALPIGQVPYLETQACMDALAVRLGSDTFSEIKAKGLIAHPALINMTTEHLSPHGPPKGPPPKLPAWVLPTPPDLLPSPSPPSPPMPPPMPNNQGIDQNPGLFTSLSPNSSPSPSPSPSGTPMVGWEGTASEVLGRVTAASFRAARWVDENAYSLFGSAMQVPPPPPPPRYQRKTLVDLRDKLRASASPGVVSLVDSGEGEDGTLISPDRPVNSQTRERLNEFIESTRHQRDKILELMEVRRIAMQHGGAGVSNVQGGGGVAGGGSQGWMDSKEEVEKMLRARAGGQSGGGGGHGINALLRDIDGAIGGGGSSSGIGSGVPLAGWAGTGSGIGGGGGGGGYSGGEGGDEGYAGASAFGDIDVSRSNLDEATLLTRASVKGQALDTGARGAKGQALDTGADLGAVLGGVAEGKGDQKAAVLESSPSPSPSPPETPDPLDDLLSEESEFM
eukprot:gene31339-6489_t